MKTGKKVMILLLVFAAAAMVYFVHPVGKKEEHGVTEYTAMEKAKFPVLYATMGEREMAPVFGQTDERGVTAVRTTGFCRDSIQSPTPLFQPMITTSVRITIASTTRQSIIFILFTCFFIFFALRFFDLNLYSLFRQIHL